MKVLNILHISDAHIQKKNEAEIKIIADKMIEDVLKVQKKEGITISLVCFTGDLIQRGDKAEKDEMQWELAMNILVNPLLRSLELSIEQFICVAGNHEVDTSNIVKATENGLKVKDLKSIDEIISEFDMSYNNRLRYFYNIISTMQKDVKFGTLGYTFQRNINGINVGIACVDSAWRSSGKGASEKGSLYVGVLQIAELYSEIKDADFKICMMHHPLDWLEDYENLDDIEKKHFGVNSSDEFEAAKNKMLDVSKLLFPVAIQNLILETVGTPKLGVAINQLMKSKQDKAFEKFMLIFLKCDLKIVNLQSDLMRYIKDEGSEGILKIVVMKLTFYYRSRFFGINTKIDSILIDLITEVHMKLNPKKGQNFIKSKIAQQIKNNLDSTGTCG